VRLIIISHKSCVAQNYNTYHIIVFICTYTNYNLISRVYRHGQIEYRTRQCVFYLYYIYIYRNTHRNSQSIRFEFSIIDRYSHDFFSFVSTRRLYTAKHINSIFIGNSSSSLAAAHTRVTYFIEHCSNRILLGICI